MKTRTTEQRTARETYLARFEEVQALIQILQSELESHKNHSEEDSRNWGFAGDMGHVRELLKDVVTSIGGYEDGEEIETMIQQAKRN